MTLFELTGKMRELADLLENAEEMPDELVQYLQDTESALEDKVDNYCHLIANLESLAKAKKEQADKFSSQSKQLLNKVDWLKSRLKLFLISINQEKYETVSHKVSIRNPGGKFGKYEIEAPSGIDEVSEEFIKQKVEKSLDKEKVLEYIVNHNEPPKGVSIKEREKYISIS